MTRQSRATDAIRDAIETVSDLPFERILDDDDLIDDLHLDELELEGLRLILEEIFGIVIRETLWITPLYRTPDSLAEYCIRNSELASWTETRALFGRRA